MRQNLMCPMAIVLSHYLAEGMGFLGIPQVRFGFVQENYSLVDLDNSFQVKI